MPRGDFTVHFASRGRGNFIRAEEAAGIAFLAIVLTALFILGCWYYRKRNGYRMIQNPRGPSLSWRELVGSGQYNELGAARDDKMALNEFSNAQSMEPDLNPIEMVYNELERRVKAQSEVLSTSRNSIKTVRKPFQFPNAPPAYEKITTGPSPPPYSP